MLGETWIILGARSWRLHNLVEDLDEEIGVLMGELLVVILLLDHDLDPETVRPHGPLPPRAMKCIRHFGKCKIG